MENLFYTCSNFPDIDSKYVDEAVTSNYKINYTPRYIFTDVISSFEQTDFYKKIKQDLLCGPPTYVKSPANSYYDWHVDVSSREVSLNIPLVSNEQCITCFRSQEIPRATAPFYRLYKVDYMMYKPSILNVKKHHCVINYSNEDRFVINISFHVVPYERVLEYFKNIKIDNY
jgi:hypothetical protein